MVEPQLDNFLCYYLCEQTIVPECGNYSAESLDRNVLLSFDFTMDEDTVIIDVFRKNMRYMRAVMTRNIAEKENNENEELETARSGGKMLKPNNSEQFYSGIEMKESLLQSRMMLL